MEHHQQVCDDVLQFFVGTFPSCWLFFGVGRMVLLPFFPSGECYRYFASNSLHLLAR
jgi:hypothetical protein